MSRLKTTIALVAAFALSNWSAGLPLAGGHEDSIDPVKTCGIGPTRDTNRSARTSKAGEWILSAQEHEALGKLLLRESYVLP
jgi:hypothetical protein